MSDFVKGLLTVLISTALPPVTVAVIVLALHGHQALVFVAVAAGFGFLYGLEAALVAGYDLSLPVGWFRLILDHTWSLPNTVFGFVFGNIIYIFLGTPSTQTTAGLGWIAYEPRMSLGFCQTIGTVNIGGAGNHELVHVMQARIFGPIFLAFHGLNYVVNFVIQSAFTLTIGMVLWILKVRDTPYLRPYEHSVLKTPFIAWIYAYTIMELWAYGSE
jgi:hypothetical protein